MLLAGEPGIGQDDAVGPVRDGTCTSRVPRWSTGVVTRTWAIPYQPWIEAHDPAGGAGTRAGRWSITWPTAAGTLARLVPELAKRVAVEVPDRW